MPAPTKYSSFVFLRLFWGDYLQNGFRESIMFLLSGSNPHFTHVSGRRFAPAFLKGKVLRFLHFLLPIFDSRKKVWEGVRLDDSLVRRLDRLPNI